MTKQGLEASLYTALEFGYKCHEKGMNLQAAFAAAHPDIMALVEASGLRLEWTNSLAGETRMSTTNIPYIDPNVQHVGISRLRSLNATQLREIDKTLVIQENDQPLAVLLKYEEFLIMQQKLMSVLDTISVMADDAELAGIMAGLKEMNGGQTKSITEIRATLKTKKEKV